MCGNRHCIGIRSEIHGQLQRMILPMQVQNAIDRQCLGLGRLKGAIQMYWTKGYRSIFGTLKNALVHFVVACTISAFATRGIDYEKPCHPSCSRIKMNDATLERESAMNGMQNRSEGPMDRCACWIESYIDDARLLCLDRDGQKQQAQTETSTRPHKTALAIGNPMDEAI